MSFETLEFLEGAQVGITVIEPNDKTNSNYWLVFFQVIDKGAAVRSFVDGPANCVFNETRSKMISMN